MIRGETETTAYRIIEIKRDAAYLTREGIEKPNTHAALVYQADVLNALTESGPTTIQFEDGSTYFGTMATWKGSGRETDSRCHTHKFTLMDENHAFFKWAHTGRP